MLDIQKRLTNTFYAILSLPATAMGFALSVQIAALSWILSTQYGLDIHDVGLVWAAGPLAGIIGQVIIGVISDKVWFWNGRRRPFIFIGGVLAALMLLALPNIGIIKASLGIEGILGIAILVALTLDLAINVSFNPTRSIIADVTPQGRARTKGYTWMQTVSGTFGVLAYLVGALINNYVLIYGGAVLVLLFSVIPPFFIKEPRVLGNYGDENAQQSATKNRGSSKNDKASLVEILRTIRPLWGFLIYAIYAMIVRLAGIPKIPYHIFEIFALLITVVLIAEALLKKEDRATKEENGIIGFQKVLAAHSFTWVGVQTMFIYLYAFAKDRIPGISDMELGRVVAWSFFSLNLVAAIIPVTILEPLAARLGRVKVHAASIAIMAIGYLGILFFGVSPLYIYLLMAIVGIGWAATISLPFAIMSQKVPQTRMGLYMGLFNLSVVLPQLVASLGIGELISEADDKGITFIVCAATVAFSAIAWTLVKEPADKPS
ncbi:MAG: MFS transporter [Bacteroidales bacterium]|nr:MFS transporter [Bacteroidales bacterium]MDZ4204143.1 MFS transporter [Bacteroidales bacterium]